MTETALPPPALVRPGLIGWLRRNLFATWYDSLLTLLIFYAAVRLLPGLAQWGLADAVWSGESAACRADGAGACWAFVAEKARFILFGTFPPDQHWRPVIAMLITIGLLLGSTDKRLRGVRLLAVWPAGLAVAGALMAGGVSGLDPVPTHLWGRLPLTLGLSVLGLALAFPLGVLLALGRTSPLPVFRALSTVYIELVRGVPLISILFMASVMIPLFLPQGVSVDKLLRALIGLILFAAAYLAEVVRAGLQATPKGQTEAASALGLSYGQRMRMVVLPQALALVIPPLVNTFIAFFKDTSLVVIIGLLDLLGSAKTALTDPAWRGFYREAYLFVALVYFIFCFAMSRYSRYLEADLSKGRRR